MQSKAEVVHSLSGNAVRRFHINEKRYKGRERRMRAMLKLSLTVMMAVMLIVVAACGANGGNSGSNAPSNNNGATDATQSEATPTPKVKSEDPVKVVWWHSMGGELGGYSVDCSGFMNACSTVYNSGKSMISANTASTV